MGILDTINKNTVDLNSEIEDEPFEVVETKPKDVFEESIIELIENKKETDVEVDAPVVEKAKQVIIYDKTDAIIESVYEGTKYTIVGNILGKKKGTEFVGSESQIKELLEYKVIKPTNKLTAVEKAELGLLK